jgi:hypothetical protein
VQLPAFNRGTISAEPSLANHIQGGVSRSDTLVEQPEDLIACCCFDFELLFLSSI